MAYQFTGFLARPSVPRPVELPPGATWRDITSPFAGVGIRLPEWVDVPLAAGDIERFASELGVKDAERWLYLTYVCWGGAIDFVYGYGMAMGEVFGPIEESDWSKVEATFTGLMERLGVPPDDALQFAPFTRGFWGEA